MKIAFVITGLSSGGAETMLLRLLERIDRTKFAPHVISLSTHGEMGPRIAALGIPVEAMGMRKGLPDPIRFFGLVWRLRQIKPEVVHTWLYHADLLGGLAAKMAKVPMVIWSVRSADFLLSDTGWGTRITVSFCARFSSRLPDIVLYNSQKGADCHKTWGYKESRRIVVPNGIDLDKFRPEEQARLDVRRELGVPLSTPLIGMIGRYDPLKNHEGFIQAAAYLHRIMPEVHFLMAGQDVDSSNQFLKRLIKDAGLADHCHLLGCRSDIPRITAALDLASLASWSEAFPNVLIEAMACGVPCVSTDAGDAAQILGDDGWIVPVGDMVGLADKWAGFLQLAENQRHVQAERVRRRVMDRYEIGAVVRRFESIYHDALAQHGAG